jgi:phosphatidate phosphatase PAH1
MTKKPLAPKTKIEKQATQHIASKGALQEIFDVSDTDLSIQKVHEIAKLLWIHENASEGTKHKRVVRAVELYESLEPEDGAEGMLALQMVGTHDAALECLKRAALSNQTFEGRDMALKHAQKLMALYTQQLAALNKHRGKGQQKVTVEHVNVQAGGQAIVGNVDAGAARRVKKDQKPEIVEHEDRSPQDGTKVPKLGRSKKRGG